MSFSDSDSSSHVGDHKYFRHITRDRLLQEMLGCARQGDSRSTWKVLIMDRFTVKIMSHACKMADITDAGVSLVEDIYKRRQPLPTMDAVYFIQPTKEKGTQLTWQYRRHRRRRLGFICYHNNQSRIDEQLKLVAFNETPVTVVKPTPKPKLKLKLRLVEKLLIGGLAVCSLGFLWLGFVIMSKERVFVGSLPASSMSWEVICSKSEHDSERWLFSMLLSSFSFMGLVLILGSYQVVDEGEYEKRLALKILGVIFMLGFVAGSVEFMSVSYRIDILSRLVYRDWHWPYHLNLAILTVSIYICGIGVLIAHEYYQKVDENNDSEKGLDLNVFGVILMGADVACSPEFMSIAYAMDTLSRSVFRDLHWPYNLNLAVFFISLHICCRGLRAVVELHHKHSRLPGCEKNYLNKRSWKHTRSLCKNSSRRRMNRQK